MKNYRHYLAVLAVCLSGGQNVFAQTYIDETGELSQRNDGTFNPHSKDSTKQGKVIPKGIYVWSVDRKFGDVIKAEVDTLPHLFPQSTLSAGRNGQYNTIGSNFAARQNRLFFDRQEKSQFAFLDVYDQVIKQPEAWHFTNTLSPITNLTYHNCGDKTNGEDHLDAMFAANASKRFGAGFDLNYAYARGYFQNQSNSHFGATLFASYLGDQYQMHTILSTFHEKATENGGITQDNYITHPEQTEQTFSSNEIPTILERNWNRNDHHHLFLTHRYSLGFYRKVKMTDEEIAAKKFAEQSAKQNQQHDGIKDNKVLKRRDSGRQDTENQTDTTRIKVESKQVADSLLAIQTAKDSLDALMKDEFVPVTSFIHTMELGSYDRYYQAYKTPTNYYANTYADKFDNAYSGDSIYDQTKYFNLKNTLGIALLEGFNKYAPAGLKVFATHELRRFDIPALMTDGSRNTWLERINEHNISIGGQLQKTQGHTLHYNLMAETWLVGEDAGQLKLDGQADLNFAFLGDTVRLAAKAYIHRLNPTFFERHYHGKHFWWDNNLDKETRTRIEGTFAYEKTNTKLRVAIEEIQNYTYYGMSYLRDQSTNQGMTFAVRQYGSNLNIMTAQLDQKLHMGPLQWNNILTYQSSSSESVLPLPTLNVFSNLYLEFMVANVLRVELGASATWFTEYDAPDFCPAVNQFAVQENADSRVSIGNFPFVDVYANLHLKHTRFFLMMQNVLADSLNRRYFLTPHYPINASVLHFGVSWNFFN